MIAPPSPVPTHLSKTDSTPRRGTGLFGTGLSLSDSTIRTAECDGGDQDSPGTVGIRRQLEDQVFRNLGGQKTTMVDQNNALAGRDTPIEVTETHAVLGTPLQGPWPENTQTIYIAMGCFWGAERFFWQTPGVYSTAVGYMGGYTPNPTYEETCTARTGHAEAVQIVFDPAKVDLDTVLKIFWENHDPTTPNRQGNDVGTQYRSAIYPTTAAQMEVVQQSAAHYQKALDQAGFGTISTQITPAEQAGDGHFYYAEDYHQAYLHKNPGGYCNHGFCQVGYDLADHGQTTPDVQVQPNIQSPS